MPKHDLSHRRGENIVDCKGDWNAAEKKQKPNQNQKHQTTNIIDEKKAKATVKAMATATATAATTTTTTGSGYMKGKSKSPRNVSEFLKSSDSSDTTKTVGNHETVDKNETVLYKDENKDNTDDLFFEERILRIILIPILEFLADNRTDINNFVAVNKFFANNSKSFVKPWPKHCVLNCQERQSEPYYRHPCLVWSKDMSTIFCTNNPDDDKYRYGYKSIYVFGREKGYGGKMYTLPDTDIHEIIRMFTLSPCEKWLVVATETAATPWTIRILHATKEHNYEQLKELNIPGYYDDDWQSHCIEDLAVSPCSKYIAIVDVSVYDEEQKARIIVYTITGNVLATIDKKIHENSFDRYPRVMFSSDCRAVIFDDLTDSMPYMDCIKVWRPFGRVDDDDDNNDKDDDNDKGDNGRITTVGLGRFTLNLGLQISSDGTRLLSRVLDNVTIDLYWTSMLLGESVFY